MLRTSQIKQSCLTWLPVILLVLFAYWVQSHMYVHDDNIYFLHDAKLWLAGGNYLRGFIDPNPPLIILLYTPVVLLANYTHSNLLTVFNVYILLLGSFSITLSYQLLDKIFTDKKLVLSVLYVTTIVMFFLPTDEYGQREHLLIILTLPYIFTAIARLQNISISTYFAIMIGVFAGLGICLKPYFMTLPIFIESYFIFRNKNIFAWLRAESFTILCVAMAYLYIVILVFPNYINAMIPLIAKYYLLYSFSIMLKQLIVIYAISILIVSLILCRKSINQNVFYILSAALLALIVSYLLCGRMEYYDKLPMFSLATILGFYCCWQMKKTIINRFAIFVILLFPCCAIFIGFNTAIQERNAGDMRSIISFFQQHPDATYDYYSYHGDSILLNNYANAQFVGQFFLLWWLQGIDFELEHAQMKSQYEQAERDKQIFVNILANTLNSKKPAYQLVDADAGYIKTFTQYPLYREAWQHYRYTDTLGGYDIYQRF